MLHGHRHDEAAHEHDVRVLHVDEADGGRGQDPEQREGEHGHQGRGGEGHGFGDPVHGHDQDHIATARFLREAKQKDEVLWLWEDAREGLLGTIAV